MANQLFKWLSVTDHGLSDTIESIVYRQALISPI